MATLAACADTPETATIFEPTSAFEPTFEAAHLPGNSAKGTVVYMADLMPLNGSGVSGRAQVLVRQDDVRFSVVARGVTPDIFHAQHVHGFINPVMASQCPTLATDDVNSSGFVEVGEGVDGVGMDYGGILVPLDGSLNVFDGLGEIATFPVATKGGTLQYNESISKADLAVGGGTFADLSLGNHAVVIHGMMVEGEYVATLPVACGLLSQTNATP